VQGLQAEPPASTHKGKGLSSTITSLSLIGVMLCTIFMLLMAIWKTGTCRMLILRISQDNYGYLPLSTHEILHRYPIYMYHISFG
jgi:hypothetical protein